jgi:E3 ubiquitin-protein ligase MYCBP2
LPEFTTVTVLPPALKGLVFLWEELSSNCLQVINQQSVLPSPIVQPQNPKHTKQAANEDPSKATSASTPAKEINNISDKREKKNARDKKDWKPLANVSGSEPPEGIEKETICELCGLMFPHPVTYHMKLMHPGCGWHSGGNGYNSGGNYCIGWAGNCGDGGGGGSSWYLLCDTCRDKYLKVSSYEYFLPLKFSLRGTKQKLCGHILKRSYDVSQLLENTKLKMEKFTLIDLLDLKIQLHS